MSANGDITLNAILPAGISAIGASISYGVNAIPVCQVILDPSNFDSSILENPDAVKRQQCTVSISMQDTDNNLPPFGLDFIGLFDGISVSQGYGSITYSAVIKGLVQPLAETYTQIPGVSGMGLNPFTRCLSGLAQNSADGDPSNAYTNMLIQNKEVFNGTDNVPTAYKKMMLFMLNEQATTNFRSFLSSTDTKKLDNGTIAILDNPAYKAKAAAARTFLDQALDTTGIDGITEIFNAGAMGMGDSMVQGFLDGPGNYWENMLDFYGRLGCVVVPINDKIFIIPDNGFIPIAQQYPGKGQIAAATNTAYPAGYMSFSYNDNGYRDVGYCLVEATLNNSAGSVTAANVPLNFIGCYPSEGGKSIAPYAGVVVVRQNPFMLFSGDQTVNTAKAHPRAARQATTLVSNIVTGSRGYKGGYAQVDHGSIDKQTSTYVNTVSPEVINNYAQLKCFQARYLDRTGQITMPLNNNWVPGTVGTLYTNVSDVWLNFFVTNVTHSISLNPQANGTAITIVSFNCGRMGSAGNIATIPEDLFFNYDQGVMLAVQSNFIEALTPL